MFPFQYESSYMSALDVGHYKALYKFTCFTFHPITALHSLRATRSRHEKAVCQSDCLSNVWIVTKWKKLVPTFLNHMKDRSA